MWNARRNGRWFGWGCLFLSCSILLFRSAAVLRKNHFLEGKVLLQRAAAQAEQLSVDVMMPLLFYDGKEDGRGWMENLLAAVRGSDTGASGGKHGRKYAVCRDRSSGNGYGEAGFESGTGSRKRADRIEGAGN